MSAGRGKGEGGRVGVEGGSFLTLDELRVRFSDTVTIGPVSLSIARGEILALLGPSGSGKTTLLRMLAGFERPDGGTVRIEGEDVTAVPPARRRVGMVFQHYALFPHLDVGENVAFGLEGKGEGGRGKGAVVAEALSLVDLAGFERRKVQELSGGQQQRVALARALAPAPRVLALDEPLSNLDPSLRERTRRELRQLIKRIGITAVFVTHEQEEAFDLGDRVAVLSAGRLNQVGTPEDLYERPANLFVGTFVGRANVLRGAAARALGAADGEVVLVRPERLRFASGGGLRGVVAERRYTGAAALFQVDLETGERVEVQAEPQAASVGDRVRIEAARTLRLADRPGER
jgi:ABC-type Fe3+/spermidine/putrescine transport system ATPase subunit